MVCDVKVIHDIMSDLVSYQGTTMKVLRRYSGSGFALKPHYMLREAQGSLKGIAEKDNVLHHHIINLFYKILSYKELQHRFVRVHNCPKQIRGKILRLDQ